MEKLMTKMATEIITLCAEKYGFSVEEALSSLDLVKIKGNKGKSQSKSQSQSQSVKKVRLEKCKFPLPFSGEPDTGKCSALRQNCGLYTQCISDKMVDSEYCKRCSQLSKKSETGIPEYGTIEMRLSCGIQEYVDPKGRKPTTYAKIMNKYNLSRTQVEEEASRHGITVSEVHFEVGEESKRGRPSTKPKVIKESKGVKGRPKKAEKVIKLNDESEDLFASLLAEAEQNSENNSIAEQNSEQKERAYTLPSDETLDRERCGMENEDKSSDVDSDLSSEESDLSSELSNLSSELSNLSLENSDNESKARANDVAIFQQLTKAERAKAKEEKEQAKEEKAKAKAEKEQAKAAEKAKEKAEKEQAKAAEKAKEKAEKEQAKAAAEKANTEDPTKATIENALTETATIDKTKVEKKVKEHVQKIIQEAKEENEKAEAKAQEPPKETYKKFTGPDGKKYLRSSESNNVYDYEVYTTSQELEQVGKWDPNTKTAIFNVDESEPELSDEEFDEDD
jgi:hypothetical protein